MLSTIGRVAISRVSVRGPRSSSARIGEWTWQLQRVCITRNLYDAAQAHSTRESRIVFSPRRPYATSTETPPKSPAKKATTTPKAQSTTAKKPARGTARKAAAKPKKKSAARKRPVKKALTEAQKVRRAEVKAKLELKELKAAALLSPPKPLPATAWAVLFSQDVKEKKFEMGIDFSGAKIIITSAATRYKNLDPSEREHYNHIANQNKQANEIAFKQWVESHTPEQIRIANAARMRLKRKEGKRGSQKYHSIEDSRLPKRGRNAHAVFTTERWASGDMKGIPLVEATKTLNEEWNTLSPAQKKHFEDVAEAEKRRYAQEYKAVFHHDLPSNRKAATAT